MISLPYKLSTSITLLDNAIKSVQPFSREGVTNIQTHFIFKILIRLYAITFNNEHVRILYVQLNMLT